MYPQVLLHDGEHFLGGGELHRDPVLEVADDNAGAIALYSGAGFGRVGARRGYYPRETGAVDALVMRRDLNTKA